MLVLNFLAKKLNNWIRKNKPIDKKNYRPTEKSLTAEKSIDQQEKTASI